MTGFRRILVCWGDAVSNAGLLLYARALTALSPPPELVFLHVAPGIPVAPRKAAQEQVRRLEHLREAVAREIAPDGATRCCVRMGEPLDEILLYAAEIQADAILLGHHPERRGRRSLARRFAAAAPCAVWMAPNGSAPRISCVLAAFDLSDSSAEAVRAAAAISSSAGLAEVHLLHVRRNPPLTTENDLRRFLSTLGLVSLPARLLLEDGAVPGRAAVNIAARLGADLLVMGARGQNPSATVLLGSETEQALRESTVPVLVVRAAAFPALSVDTLLSDQASVGKP